MWTIAIDVPHVCQSVTRLRCANTVERTKVLLPVETLGDLRNIGGLDFPVDSMWFLSNYFDH